MPITKTETKDEKQVKDEIEYLYRRYQIDIEMLAGIAGGIPMTGGLAASHVAKFSNRVSNDLKLSMKTTGEVSDEAAAKYMLSCSSGFSLDEGGIYIRGYQINAMLKDAAQSMKATMKTKGLGRTIRDGGLLFPDRIYLGVEPTIIEKGIKPENAPASIKIFQVADGVKLSIPCALLENGDLPDKLFRQMWIVAQGVGLGANRHLGYGKFSVTNIEQTGDWNIADLFRVGEEAPKEPVEMSPVPEAVAGSPGLGSNEVAA
ncbi:MAG: hypothetical protein V3S68_09185 [Dehalococcoidia bacterium]